MTDQHSASTTTSDDPAFAASVIEATRELIAQVAAWAREGTHATDDGAIVAAVSDGIQARRSTAG